MRVVHLQGSCGAMRAILRRQRANVPKAEHVRQKIFTNPLTRLSGEVNYTRFASPVRARDSGQAISGLITKLSRVDWVKGFVSTATGRREPGRSYVVASPQRSLTSGLKKGKRRRRSPGGSERRASAWRIEQTLAISAFQPSPWRAAFGATRARSVSCEGTRYAEIPWRTSKPTRIETFNMRV